MASSRHGRPRTFSKPVWAILIVVVAGTGAVAIFAGSILAVRLAVGGALAAMLLVGTSYDAALRAARAEAAHVHAEQARLTAELSQLRSK